jgi:hypothetical protein
MFALCEVNKFCMTKLCRFLQGEEDLEALVDDGEAKQLEANEKKTVVSALASVLQHFQPLASVEHPEQEEQRKQHQPVAREVDPRVLRADLVKTVGDRESRHRGKSSALVEDQASCGAAQMSSSEAVAAEASNAERHISVEHVGSTSKWTQVQCDVCLLCANAFNFECCLCCF